jgi:hypothetical protein
MELGFPDDPNFKTALADLKKKYSKEKRKGRKLSSSQSRQIRLHGHRAERDLVKKLRIKGFKAVRIPVSAPSTEPLPDVFATKDDFILAFEVKSTSFDKIYYKKDQVRKNDRNSLENIAERLACPVRKLVLPSTTLAKAYREV